MKGRPVATYRVGLVEVDVNHQHEVVTHRWHGGLTLHAAPVLAPEHLALAETLGYHDDLWAMTIDHELLHQWLAVHRDGYSFSPTLWSVAVEATGVQVTDLSWMPRADAAQRRHEEDRVLACQLVLPKRTNGHMTRPWVGAATWHPVAGDEA